VNRNPRLHLLEQVRERSADLKRFLALLQPDFQTAVQVAMDGRDGVDIDDGAPVDRRIRQDPARRRAP
jgi:hypothetical protein